MMNGGGLQSLVALYMLMRALSALHQGGRGQVTAQPSTQGKAPATGPGTAPQAQGYHGTGQGFQGEKGPLAAAQSPMNQMMMAGVPQQTAQNLGKAEPQPQQQPNMQMPSLAALLPLLGMFMHPTAQANPILQAQSQRGPSW